MWTTAEATLFTVQQTRQSLNHWDGFFVLCANPSVIGSCFFSDSQGCGHSFPPPPLSASSSILHTSPSYPSPSTSWVLVWGSVCLAAAEAPHLHSLLGTLQGWGNVQTEQDTEEGVQGAGWEQLRAACGPLVQACIDFCITKLEFFVWSSSLRMFLINCTSFS